MPDPICPFAEQYILHGGNHDQRPTIIPIGTALHTAVTSAAGDRLGDYFNTVTDDSTFYVDHDGTIWQFNPVNRKANAQYGGNAFTMGTRLCGMVSVETWDGGNPATPFTDAQLDALERLYAWLNTEWGISLDVSTEWNGPGAGWHSKYREWNTDAHNCPGDMRVRQLLNIVLPRARLLTHPAPPPHQEDDMALTPPIEIVIDHTTGRGFAVVPGVKVNDVRGFVPRVESGGAMKGVVPDFGLDWTGAPDGDAVVWGQLATPPVVNVTVHVQIAHA